MDGNDIKIKSSSFVCHKKILTSGVWSERPREGGKCKVKIDYVESENITLHEIQVENMSFYLNSEFNGTLIVGDSDTEIDRSLERCIQTMLIMEISLIILTVPETSRTIHNSKVRTITCKVHLKELHNEPHIFEWSDDKKYERAFNHKVQGVELYKCGRTRDAFLRFSKALKLLITIIPVQDNDTAAQQGTDVTSLRVMLCNNIASCHLLYKNYSHVITMCNKVLVLEPNNIKALFRRAIAYMEIHGFEKAKEDLHHIQQLEPGNITVKLKLQELKMRQRESNIKLADVMKKMFS